MEAAVDTAPLPLPSHQPPRNSCHTKQINFDTGGPLLIQDLDPDPPSNSCHAGTKSSQQPHMCSVQQPAQLTKHPMSMACLHPPCMPFAAVFSRHFLHPTVTQLCRLKQTVQHSARARAPAAPSDLVWPLMCAHFLDRGFIHTYMAPVAVAAQCSSRRSTSMILSAHSPRNRHAAKYQHANAMADHTCSINVSQATAAVKLF